MRVIAGSAKGVRLGKVPEGTRPLTDRAREGLFSSLAPELAGAVALDLFAGTGAMGIEALSRGAASAVFVERSKAAVTAIRDNLERTKLADRARVVSRPVAGFLQGRPEPADLVFLDPPYSIEEDALSQVMGLIAARDWLAREGWTVALTRPAKSYTPVIPIDWCLAKRLDYGDTLITLYREV